MSALFRAGASFTPSPVIATISWLTFNASTILTLCSGETRAKTPVSMTSRCRVASSICSNSGPAITRWPGSSKSISSAIAWAVLGKSPVIITVRIPARRASLMAVFTCKRGGSIMPSKPTKVKSRSTFSGVTSSTSSRSTRKATASTRSASCANFPLASRICIRTLSVNGAGSSSIL